MERRTTSLVKMIWSFATTTTNIIFLIRLATINHIADFIFEVITDARTFPIKTFDTKVIPTV